MSNVVYVSVPEVVDEHSALYITPNRIYKGIWDGYGYGYSLEGVWYSSTGKLTKVIVSLTHCAWISHGNWDIRTEEEYIAQQQR